MPGSILNPSWGFLRSRPGTPHHRVDPDPSPPRGRRSLMPATRGQACCFVWSKEPGPEGAFPGSPSPTASVPQGENHLRKGSRWPGRAPAGELPMPRGREWWPADQARDGAHGICGFFSPPNRSVLTHNLLMKTKKSHLCCRHHFRAWGSCGSLDSCV